MKHLRWYGPILDCSGYASAARGYLKACQSAGIIVQPRDRSRSFNLKNKGMDNDILSMYETLYKNQVPDNCPTVQHQVPDAFYIDRKSSLSIGYTIFEMTSIPATWSQKCNEMGAIWTGSHYSKAAFLNGGIKVPIKVVPHAIDINIFNPEAQPWQIANARSFKFLSIFDFTERKAWKDLLKAWYSAFFDKDDVCLILKVFFGSFSHESIRDVVRRINVFKKEAKLGNGAPILIYGYDIPENKMPGLYRSCDCYVGISREGFGLPYAEAMACGLAVIGPEVGGNREFMNESNSFLVRYAGDEPIGLETATMFPVFHGLKWATHSWEHLAEQMKFVCNNKEEADKRAKNGLETIVNDFSPNKIGNIINSLI